MDALALLNEGIVKQNRGDLDGAEKLYLQVQKLMPSEANAHHLLGTIYKLRGQVDLAIKTIDLAISIHPQALFYNNLGTCYYQKMEKCAAALCFQQALTLQADYVDALNNLGLIQMEWQQFDSARATLNKALLLDAGNLNVLCNMGKVCINTDKDEEALQWYERALVLYPQSTAALMGKVGCLGKANRVEDALILIDSIVKIDPSVTAEAMQKKGQMLQIAGRLDDACEAFDMGLAATPGAIELAYSRSRIKKIQKEEKFFTHLTRLESVLPQLIGLSKARLSYAIAKGYDDVGDLANASRFYAIGAAAALHEESMDESDEIIIDNEIIKSTTRVVLDELAVYGADSERPIFILGMPRSGTTLVEQILSSHPDVCAGGELTYINDVFANFKLSDAMISSGGSLDSIKMDTPFQDRARAYLSLLNAIEGSERSKHVTDKMPANYKLLGYIAALFPKAKIIHCRRDPLDNCQSCYTILFGSEQYWSYDLALLGRHYRRYWNLMAHWRAILPGRFLEVRYEQIVDDTERYARELIAWCGLEWNDACLRFYENKRNVNTASVTQVRQPIYTSSMYKWKKWEPYIQPLIDEIRDIEEAYWAEVGEVVAFDQSRKQA